MSPPRFLVEQLPASGTLQLASNEARHASNVLRLNEGDAIVLFDGAGGEASATVESIQKRAVSVLIGERTNTDRELGAKVELIVALPKGDRQKSLVDGLVQLGVSTLTPLVAIRGVAQPNSKSLQRLERSIVESCKQCGRNQLMQIGAPISVADLAVRNNSAKEQDGLTLFAHPYGESKTLVDIGGHPRGVRIAIGPEGGFTDLECQALRAGGWTQVSLGKRILRIEVASLMVAAWRASLFAD